MLKKVRNKLKSYDMFGHVPQLNFSNNEPSHKTLIGGIASIIVYVSLFDIITNKFITMITRDNNQIS